MDKKLDLPRDEMAFRKIYKDLVAGEKITTVFRPGKRLCGDFRSYCLGEKITIRIIENVGADWAKIAPQFETDFRKIIEIIDTSIMKLKDLTSKDFLGSSPDVCDKKSLIYHLGLIYNLSIDELNDESSVTKIKFQYI